MKTSELVELKLAAGRFFLASWLLLQISTGQPVTDDVSSKINEGAKVIYNQRQSGQYNIRINIRDLAIIEMGSNILSQEFSEEEDYYYDEDDFTVKPLKLTTASHTTSPSVFMPQASIQTDEEHVRIEERSASGTTSSRVSTKLIKIKNTVLETQTAESVSLQTTKQIYPSHRQTLFYATESLTSKDYLTLQSHSNQTPPPNFKSPIKFKPNITAADISSSH
ncbi:uncharacterized protein [Eurosta solidaginis]|uniref:uncharacterized protein n=1 Tax=Eurosta solidaginis TaxID=178769 RepID=UPI00353124DB